jgi:class 3 adenylate cyclase
MASTRRLAAILAADVAGYSRLMGADEEGTLERLKAHRRQLIDPKIAEHHGRIVKTTGDGLLVEFQSIVDAVRCAVEVQRGIAQRNAALPEDKRIEFRIGINLGDIILDEGDIFGDGVNVAARLEALAEPGGICVSRVVRDQVRDKLDAVFEDMGEQQVKNIARPVRAYRVRASALTHLGARAPRFPLSRIAGEGAEGHSPEAGEGSSAPLALGPGQHSTPRKSEKGAGILAPFLPRCCQAKQLVHRSDAMACDGSLPFGIPAFRGPVAGKGFDPIRRSIAYVVGECFNPPEPCLLEEPAKSMPDIRVGDSSGSPHPLADVVKAPRAGRLFAR